MSKRIVTEEVVERVGKLFAKGVPLRHALTLENNPQINVDSFHKSLQRNSKFKQVFELAGASFAATAVERLVSDPDARHLRWVLERRFPADYGSRPEGGTVNQSIVINGFTPEQLAAIRAAARRNSTMIDVKAEPVEPKQIAESNS